MKFKKSYYKDGVYIDTTTNRKYIPKGVCCLCGSKYGIQIHHYIEQQRCRIDLFTVKTRTPKTLTQQQINEKQKLFEVCGTCHNAIHNLDDLTFKEFFNKNRSDFLYKE